MKRHYITSVLNIKLSCNRLKYVKIQIKNREITIKTTIRKEEIDMDIMNLKRGQVESILGLGVACVVFKKQRGELRCMLATRDITVSKKFVAPLAYELANMDRRNEKHKQVASVIDLEIGEVRSFRIDRVIYFEDLGSVDTLEEYQKVKKQFNEFKKAYEIKKEEIIDPNDQFAELNRMDDTKLLKIIGDVTLNI